MSLRVARIPYLNSVPFYQGLPAAGIELMDLPPRDLGRAAMAGEVDAGILSLCDAFRCPDFEPLGNMGVATDGPAHSVLLFSQRPPAELQGATVAVTTETSTSIRLLGVVLEERYGVNVERQRRPHPATDAPATLLIGDSALRAARDSGLVPGRSRYGPGVVRLESASGPWRWVLDLGQAWKELTGLPFVFAEWMVRTGVDRESRERLRDLLEGSLSRSLGRTAALGKDHGSVVGLDGPAAQAYLDGFTYRIGPRERQGISAFRARLAALGDSSTDQLVATTGEAR